MESHQNLYLTDFPETMLNATEKRQLKFVPGLKEKWADSPTSIEKTASGEEILYINGHEVMRGFELPYMRELAEVTISQGGRVLNIGFGLGQIDTYIQELGGERLSEHHIVELNAEIYEKAQEWRLLQRHPERIFIHCCDWRDALKKFEEQGLVFDGVNYDAFPLELNEMHRDSIPFIQEFFERRLLKEHSGVMTFYADVDGEFGQGFLDFIKRLGVQSFSSHTISIKLPEESTEYWKWPIFHVPKLTRVEYGRSTPR